MIVGQTNYRERGSGPFLHPSAEVFGELLVAQLIRNTQVEGWKASIRGEKHGIGDRRVQDKALPFRECPVELIAAFDLEPFAVVAQRQAGIRNMLPEQPKLGLILRHGTVGASGKGAAARGAAK